MGKHNDLIAIDYNHLWHPFTQTSTWSYYQPLIIESGKGCYLFDTDAKRYLDGVSSIWCNVHGHAVPEIVAAIQEQAQQICHSTLLGLSHRPILELTSKLISVIPPNLSRVFYADSGSTAVEAALRIALEYCQKSDDKQCRLRTRFASLEGGYHGDTLGAVGVGYLDTFHRHLEHVVKPALRFLPPHVIRMKQGLEPEAAVNKALAIAHDIFEIHGHELAALIVEPLVQGAAGIWVHPPKYLQGLARLCQQFSVLLIADEVATGFGKTGSMFAVQTAGVEPDLLVMGKGLSGGYLPISAVAVAQNVFEGFTGAPQEFKTFYYGQTFAGNPLAAAASIASLRLFAEKQTLKHVQFLVPEFHRLLSQHVASLPNVFEIRQLGIMTGIELTSTPGKLDPFPVSSLAGERIVQEARKRGVIVRPLGNTMVLMPPLAISLEELEELVVVTGESIVSGIRSIDT